MHGAESTDHVSFGLWAKVFGVGGGEARFKMGRSRLIRDLAVTLSSIGFLFPKGDRRQGFTNGYLRQDRLGGNGLTTNEPARLETHGFDPIWTRVERQLALRVWTANP